MIFGATVFGYIVGSIADLAGQDTGVDSLTAKRISVLKDFCEEQNLCRKTIDAVKKHYTFWYQECSPFSHETSLLSDLPNSIRKEAILYIHRDAVERIGLFAVGTMPDWFIAAVIRRLDPQGFLPGDPIIGPEEAHTAQEIFFMFDGVALAYPSNDFDPESEAEPDETYYPGSIFGIEPILEPEKSVYCTVVCSKEGPCCVYVLRQMVLSDINVSQPELGQMLQEALTDSLVEQRLQRDKSKPATAIQSGGSTPDQDKKRVLPCSPSNSPSPSPDQKGRGQTPEIFVMAENEENHPLAPDFGPGSADSSPTHTAANKDDASLDCGLRAAAISEAGADERPNPPDDVEVSPSSSPHGLPPPPEGQGSMLDSMMAESPMADPEPSKQADPPIAESSSSNHVDTVQPSPAQDTESAKPPEQAKAPQETPSDAATVTTPPPMRLD
jgi:hypothetical protein